jgi:hypothetical protein
MAVEHELAHVADDTIGTKLTNQLQHSSTPYEELNISEL